MRYENISETAQRAYIVKFVSQNIDMVPASEGEKTHQKKSVQVDQRTNGTTSPYGTGKVERIV